MKLLPTLALLALCGCHEEPPAVTWRITSVTIGPMCHLPRLPAGPETLTGTVTVRGDRWNADVTYKGRPWKGSGTVRVLSKLTTVLWMESEPNYWLLCIYSYHCESATCGHSMCGRGQRALSTVGMWDGPLGGYDGWLSETEQEGR